MASLTGPFRRGASYYLKVVLPLDHPARAQYRSGRQVVSLGACTFREAIRAGTVRRAEIFVGVAASPRAPAIPAPHVAPHVTAVKLPTLCEVYRRWSKSKTTGGNH